MNTANSCVPLNIFGPDGSITPAMAAFVSQQASTQVKSELSQAHATINGDTPLQLWAKNPVSFAVGAEYRKYHARRSVPTLSPRLPGELGGAGGAAPDINGGLDVYEGFAEVVAPIISDRPFFEELQLEARYPSVALHDRRGGQAEVQHHHLEGGGQLGAGSGHQVPRQLQPCGSRTEHRANCSLR